MPSEDKPSLKRLLILGYGLLLFCGLGVLGGGTYVFVRQHLWRTEVREAHATIRRVFQGEGQAATQRRPRRRGRRGKRKLKIPKNLKGRAPLLAPTMVGPREFVRVFRPDGKVLASAGALQLDISNPGKEIEPFIYEHEGRQWLVVTRSLYEDDQEVGLVVLGVFWSRSQGLLTALLRYQLAVGLLALALTTLLGIVLSARLSRPLEALSEASLKIAEGDLEVRPADDTPSLEMAQLRSSFVLMTERLQQAREAQRQFVGDASHELKTPLTAIGGMAEILRNAKTPEDSALAIDTIEREVERMSLLVQDLLSLSRAQAEPLPLEEHLIEPILNSVQETLGASFPPARLMVECAPDFSAKTDPEALRRVLLNLTENALRYSEADTTVQLSAESSSEGVVLRVVDQGVGMPPEVLDKAFERFYRADPARARNTGGSGLGLAIVKALCQALGAELEIESVADQGTIVTVVL